MLKLIPKVFLFNTKNIVRAQHIYIVQISKYPTKFMHEMNKFEKEIKKVRDKK